MSAPRAGRAARAEGGRPAARVATDPMPARLDRGPELDTGPRREPCPVALLPLGASVVEVDAPRLGATHVDRAALVVLPAGAAFRVRALSPVTELLTVSVTPATRARTCREYRGDVDPERMEAIFDVPRVLPRTRWVDELAHRYVFEREVCRKTKSLAATFLPVEIVKELYFLAKEQADARTRATVVHEEGDVAARARAWIDAHLFEPLRVADLAKICHTSESTLLRTFQREVGAAPASYARERKLDAALLLLKSSRYSVGEVATRVGYASLAAFTEAFGRRFGAPPSSFLVEEGRGARLPPHGEPPQARPSRGASARRKRRNV